MYNDIIVASGLIHVTNMSIGQFFAPTFCEFRYATFYRKSPPQKTAGYMGVQAVEKLKNLGF